MSEPRFGAAVVQAAPVAFDVEATLAKAERLTAEAAAGGARLVVFPEAFVSCYPRGITFGAAVGSRTDEGRAWFRRYWESSVDIPGPVVDRLGAIAREHDVHLVIGVIERDGGTLYCTAIFLAPSGEYLGKHRKLMPTAAERLVWGFGDGSTMPVLDTPLGRLGAVICWENYMPLLRTRHVRQGHPDLVRADGRRARDVGRLDAPHRLRGPLLRPVGQPVRDPRRLPGRLSARRASRTRCSAAAAPCIVSPLGEVLAGPETGGESILHAELDLGRITEAKYDLDVVGHYARPDVFTLVVDELPATLVEAPTGLGPNRKEEL